VLLAITCSVPARIASSGSRGALRSVFWLGFVLLSVLLAHSQARANPSDSQRAIEFGRRALEAYSSGAFEVARRDFAAAEQVAHSPVFVLYLARCDRALGKLLRARELLRTVTAEDLSSQAPSPFRLAVSSAQAELDTLQGQIPSLRLTLAAPAEVSGVRLDDEAVDIARGEVEVEVDPGAHQLSVSYRNGTSEQRLVHAQSGQRGQLIEISHRLPLPARTVSGPPAHGVVLSPGPAQHERQNSSLRTWSYVTLGAGAAALIAGVISGTTALAQIEDVKRRCSSDLTCRPEDRGQVETASDWAAISTLSFIAAGGFLTVGTTAFVLSANAGKDQVGLAARGSF